MELINGAQGGSLCHVFSPTSTESQSSTCSLTYTYSRGASCLDAQEGDGYADPCMQHACPACGGPSQGIHEHEVQAGLVLVIRWDSSWGVLLPGTWLAAGRQAGPTGNGCWGSLGVIKRGIKTRWAGAGSSIVFSTSMRPRAPVLRSKTRVNCCFVRC